MYLIAKFLAVVAVVGGSYGTYYLVSSSVSNPTQVEQITTKASDVETGSRGDDVSGESSSGSVNLTTTSLSTGQQLQSKSATLSEVQSNSLSPSRNVTETNQGESSFAGTGNLPASASPNDSQQEVVKGNEQGSDVGSDPVVLTHESDTAEETAQVPSADAASGESSQVTAEKTVMASQDTSAEG